MTTTTAGQRDTRRGAVRIATEISRELGLGLSNGEVAALALWLDGDPEGQARAVYAGGAAAARAAIRAA